MELNEMQFDDARPFDGYGPGFFRIGGEIVEGAVVLTRARRVAWGGYSDVDTLTRLAADVDVVFVGTGSEIAHIPADLRAAVEALGVGIEVMNTPAACRTFNVLIGEGRRVAAAVLPVA